jgi:threonine dehydrogenase-like Zn-dependent dehydrogenase
MSNYSVTVTRRENAELLPYSENESPVGATQVGGKTVASLISAGTELNYAYTAQNFPQKPGYAAVFRAEEIGSQVQGIAPGDLLLCMGPHQSYQRSEADSVWRVPEGVSAPQAAFARLMGVSMSTLTTTNARPPGKVLVVGLGPVGHLAAQIFHACGYEVLGCDPVEFRRDLIAARGIAVADKLPLEDADWNNQAGLVVECSGHEAAILDSCHAVAKGGEVALVGVPWQKRTDISAQELLHAIFHRYVHLRSGWEWEVPMDSQEFRVGSIRENIAAALRWLAEGRVRVEGLYSKYSPRDCQSAYQDLLTNRIASLAVVFDWQKL